MPKKHKFTVFNTANKAKNFINYINKRFNNKVVKNFTTHGYFFNDCYITAYVDNDNLVKFFVQNNLLNSKDYNILVIGKIKNQGGQ